MYDLPPPPSYFQSCISLAAIIKLPPNPGAEIAYQDLRCTPEDRASIIELITTIAENNKIALLLNQTHLKNLGAQINHVHPLKFLSICLDSPTMKTNMILIFEDYFKRNALMEGIEAGLSREVEKGKLQGYLPHFTKEIGVPEGAIHSYVTAQDWEGLVRLLMHM